MAVDPGTPPPPPPPLRSFSSDDRGECLRSFSANGGWECCIGCCSWWWWCCCCCCSCCCIACWWWCRPSEDDPGAKCVVVVAVAAAVAAVARGDCGWSDRSDETECAPVRPDSTCPAEGPKCGACGWCRAEDDDGSPLSRTELAPEVCIGDISLPGPELSARARPPAPVRYNPTSLLCRECPLLRPSGGLDSPVLCGKGGERCRCVAVGGGAGCWGPSAFRFRGDSPTA